MRLLLLLIPIALIASTQSQDAAMTGEPVVDSAAVARTAYGRATAALRANNLAVAKREAARAARAWPTQPAYQWARVVIGLRAKDNDAIQDALTRYADLGLGRDLSVDTALARLSTTFGFRQIKSRHDALRAPLVRGRTAAVLPDSTFFPEGVDVDPRSGLTYVTSVRHGTIAELTPRGDYIRELFPRSGVGLGAILAVRVDPQRSVLWATMSAIPQTAGYTPADSARHALLRITLPEGEIDRRYDIPWSASGHTLGVVAIGPLGGVYVSDSRDPVLYILGADSSTLRPIRHPLFRSLQGIAPAPGARQVFVADYSHGLLKVDVFSGEVVRLADAPGSTSLGVDGLSWYDGALIAVQNGVAPPRIMRFELDSAWTKITRAQVLDRNIPIADEPTIGTIVGDNYLYVANSQWGAYDETGARIPRTVLKRPVLISVPASSR